MRNYTKFKACSRATVVLAAAIVAMATFTGPVLAMPGMKQKSLSGPWELLVQIGRDKAPLSFPITVSDENKPQKLDSTLPVMGSPIKIKLERYIPDLKWETTTVKRLGGGTIAKLMVKGPGLNQEIWLDSDNPDKQSITSSIGSVTIKKLQNADTAGKLTQALAKGQAIGILSVWDNDPNTASEYIAEKDRVITLQRSKYQLKILEYIPHYSIDTETKKVTSQSDKPINPAVKVSLFDGKENHEQWLWSKMVSPHMKDTLPIRVEFDSFDLAGMDGRHLVVVAPGAKPQIVFSKDGKNHAEKLTFNKAYPLANKEYSFSVEKIVANADIKMAWKNNSDKLLHPALILTIDGADMQDEIVLELGKPSHNKTDAGMMVLLYRLKPAA
jgi:hypothetical protein